MLRKRSRAVTSKQAIVGDHNNQQWQLPEKPTKPSSFFFTSPRIFKGFFTSSCSSSSPNSPNLEPMMSPTSILDTNPFLAVANFWVVDNNKISSNNNKNSKTLPKNTQHSWEQPNNKKGIGLALIDESFDISNNNNIINNTTTTATSTTTTTKQQKRKLVVFGSQLRIQVPPLPNSSVFPCFSPESPREFGIKTPRNNLWPFGNKESSHSHSHTQVHPEESLEGNGMDSGNESLSMSEIEQSEDYTCVISHGPNPKTTHIFGNCIVESCCGKIAGSPSFSSKRSGYFSPLGNSVPSQDNFLSFCHHCKKKLGVGRDIYMYRGEKAFCSQECRCQEMLFDGVEN